jgi:hypothetical protein
MQRQQLLIGPDLGDVVEDGHPEPFAAPLQGAQRGVQSDAPAIAAVRHQHTDQPVAAAEQSGLVVAGNVEQSAERRPYEVVGGVAEHLGKRPIAPTYAAVAIEDQDRCGALLHHSRHQGRDVGIAGRGGCAAFRN